MAIIYSYPVISPSVSDLILISKRDDLNNTMNVSVKSVVDLVPTILDLDDFPLYGQPFGNLSTIPTPGDTISFNGTDWVPGPPGTTKTEIISVDGEITGNNYTATVADISALDQTVVYKTKFNATNPVSPVTLDINNYGAVEIKRGTLTGFEDIDIDYIIPGIEYFLTYNGTIFQIHTSNPVSGASTEFINPDPTTQTLGGIPVGSTFPAKSDGSGYTMQEMWDQLLYPYQLPALSNLTITGVANTVEVGETIAAGVYDFNWSKSNAGNIQVNSGTINDITAGVPLAAAIPIESINTTPVTLPSDITKNVFKATHSWNIQGQNTQGGNISPAIKTTTWLWKRYIGNDTGNTIPEATIKGLSVNSALSSSINGTYDFPGGGFKYLCIPVDFPEPNAITSGGFPVAMADGSTPNSVAYTNSGSGPYKFDIVSVQNQFFQTINYRVYRSLNQLNGAATFIVS